MTMIFFDLGNCGSIELNPDSGEFARESILRQCWLAASTRFSHASANNVFPWTFLDHAERVPFE
jgi:hypothetical protein